MSESSCHHYRIPVKAITSVRDHDHFMKSDTYREILVFVQDCAEAVVGSTTTETELETGTVNPIITGFVSLMNQLITLVDETPPIKQPMRFGNKAFRDWHAKLPAPISSYLLSVIPEDKAESISEITPYILDMFGNPTRIDYGTGHELNFAILFLLLKKLDLIMKSDLKHVIICAFQSYIKVMRRLQLDYMLEPAGSHGVWGLDDYHCLLFLWGSAQLSRNDNHITPSSIHNPKVLDEFASEYIYLEGIKFIKRIKTGAPFAETSPMLNDISNVPEWARVCSGLMRLFQGEVLNKFPVVQHLLFGSLLVASWSSNLVN